MKPLIYIAGPYTFPDCVVNTRRAIEFGMAIQTMGAAVLVPHLSLLQHFLLPRPLEFWYGFDIDLLEHCNAVFRFSGESTGADKEVTYAQTVMGIPTFDELVVLNKWIDEWTE